MNFKSLKLKSAYDSKKDDVVIEFYIPVLSVSRKYDRLCGYFSSTSLAVAARGIQKFIENKGYMRIITSPILSKEDIDAIKEGYKERDELITESMLKELEKTLNEKQIIKDHVRALAWMVKNRYVDIKVAIPISENEIPLSIEEIEKSGIFHQKVGIMEDFDGNVLSFSGSVNETAFGWLQNVEEFKVFRSWIKEEQKYLLSDIEKFESYWNDDVSAVIVLKLPKAVEKKFVKIAPKNLKELQTFVNFERLYKERVKKMKKQKGKLYLKEEFFTLENLRDYQKEAIEKWIDNGYKGILSMATGTGKTFTAIGAIKRLQTSSRKLLTIISVPFIHLIHQWKRELKKWDLTCKEVHGNAWKKILKKELIDYKLGYSKFPILITTHKTASSEKFIKIVKSINPKHVLFVVDEAHWMGAEKLRNGLLESYEFRLGLTATPERYFDEEGTKIIKDYFGGVVYEFDLPKAIQRGFLTPYEYHPFVVELTDSEFEEYIKMTRKLARIASRNVDEEILTIFSNERSKIIKNAENKWEIFEKILKSLKSKNDLFYTLVYCTPEQFKRAKDVLDKFEIIYHEFTAKEDKKERKEILKNFTERKYQVLIAMKCLDEGVDVPMAKNAILLASSGNPREFIQRRGRILRKFKGKEKAIIFDFIVVPTFNPQRNEKYFELERKILEKELKRYEEFAMSSLNPLDSLEKIKSIRRKYLL